MKKEKKVGYAHPNENLKKQTNNVLDCMLLEGI